MKTIGVLLAMAIAAPLTAAQDRGKAEAAFEGKRVVIDYGRPPLGGRDVKTALPPGMLWRMGMNQATTLETDAALRFGELEIPDGSYSLYVRRVDEDRWSLVVNRQTGQWGTQYDPDQDVASIPLEMRELSDSVERFTVAIGAEGRDGHLALSWGKLALDARFTVR